MRLLLCLHGGGSLCWGSCTLVQRLAALLILLGFFQMFGCGVVLVTDLLAYFGRWEALGALRLLSGEPVVLNSPPSSQVELLASQE